MEKIEILFEMLKNKLVLNDRNFWKNGLNRTDISIMLKNKVLEDLSNGNYKFMAYDKFRLYGVKLLAKKDSRNAYLCFKRCYELAPDKRSVCLQYFLACLSRYDYEEAMKTYDKLVTIKPAEYSLENNLYLYLLSLVVDLDNEHAKKTVSLRDKDIMLPDIDGNVLDNDIRREIIKGKYSYALRLLLDNKDKIQYYSVRYETLRILLNKVVDNEKKFKTNLYDLAYNDDYQEIIEILSKRQNQRVLSKLETCVLLITEAIIKYKKEGIVGEVSLVGEDDMLIAAILNNDYELALKINNNYVSFNKHNPEKDVISLLLNKINDMIRDGQDDIITENNIVSEEDKMYALAIKEASEIAYYVTGEKLDFNIYVKKVGLLPRYCLLVKLVYARDYYIEENYPMGDRLVQEVEKSLSTDEIVLRFLEEVKSNRDNYKNERESYKKKLTPQ